MSEQPRYTFGTGREIVEIEQEPIPFLLDRFFPAHAFGVIFGTRGHGKSQLALTLARAHASGLPPLPIFPPVKARVAYINLDLEFPTFQERLRDCMDDSWSDNFWSVTSAFGPINIETFNHGEPWISALNDFGPDLIICDTWHKLHKRDENDSATVPIILSKLRELFGSHPAFWFLHHPTKEPGNPKFSRPLSDTARGTGALVDDTSAAIHVKKYNTLKGERVCVSFPRYRYSKEIEPITCKFDAETHLLVPVEESDETGADMGRRILARLPYDMDFSDRVKALQEAGVPRSTAYNIAGEKS